MSRPTGPLRHRLWVGVIAIVAVCAVAGYLAYDKLLARDIPIYADEAEHFKYGSVGNDGKTGLPYAIWVALPKVFSEHLPGPDGYASLGFRWEANRKQSDTPLGFSRARVGVERISINCAFCHVTTFRRTPDAPQEFVVAGSSNVMNIYGYINFLTACARDARFSPDVLLPAMEEEVRLSWLDRLLYRYLIIPTVKDGLLKQGTNFEWTAEHGRSPWGPGRIDPFNPVKFGMLQLPDDGSIGNSDIMPIWNLDARNAIRPDAPLHWDGRTDSIDEAVLSSALGDGMTAAEYDEQTRESLRRLTAFVRQTKPPASPHRPDPAAIDRGGDLYLTHCAECHDPGGARTASLIPVAEVQTDRHRADSWPQAAADAYNAYKGGRDWGFRRFRSTDSYVAVPLDGLWLRGPYLHNGSVPTLADLLEPPAQRPIAFIRGGEVLDPIRGGFVAPPCDPANPPKGEFCLDTKLPGNSNAGHVYGTELTPAEKADLLAYLLTF